MGQSKSFFKTNIIYGLLALVPSAIIVLLLAKIVEILGTMAAFLNLETASGAAISIVLGILLLLLFCFVVGMIIRTRIGSISMEKFERTVLQQIPGYQILSNILKGFAEKKTAYQAATVRLFGEGTAVFGFIMEKNGDGTVTVFVPSAPAMTVGSVHVVASDRVTIIEGGAINVSNCVSQWGIGSRKVFAGK